MHLKGQNNQAAQDVHDPAEEKGFWLTDISCDSWNWIYYNVIHEWQITVLLIGYSPYL